MTTHQIEHETERKATWTELFFDLAFVAAVRSFAHEFAHDISLVGLLTFALLFIPLWWAWVGHTLYNDRFDTDNKFNKVFSLVQMFGVAGMAVFAHDALGKNFAGFALAYIVVRSALIISYATIAKTNKQARLLARNYAIGFSMALIPWAVGIFAPEQFRPFLIILALVIDIGTPFTQTRNQKKLPLSISHLPERFGLFTILVLGEIILGSVNGLKDNEFSNVGLAIALTGIFLAFVIWWLYFRNISVSVLKKMKFASQLWLYIHLPLMMGIASVAVAIENLLHSYSEHEVLLKDIVFLGLALLSVVICLEIIVFIRTKKRS